MAKKISKEDLKSPDAFMKTMEQGLSFTTKYSKAISAAIIIAVIAAIAYVSIDALKNHKENSAAQALFEPANQYKKLHDQFESAKTQSAAADTKKNPKEAAQPKAAPASGDMQKDYGVVIEGFKRVMDQHNGTVAAGEAAIYLASIYQEYGKLDEAKSTLQKEVNDAPKASLINSIAHMVYGNILAAQGNCKEAVSSYEDVKDFLTVDASVKAGVCYEKLGQLDKAAEMYKKASAEAESSASLAAKGYLKALEQKRQTTSNQAG